jgi:hypothetical protein
MKAQMSLPPRAGPSPNNADTAGSKSAHAEEIGLENDNDEALMTKKCLNDEL